MLKRYVFMLAIGLCLSMSVAAYGTIHYVYTDADLAEVSAMTHQPGDGTEAVVIEGNENANISWWVVKDLDLTHINCETILHDDYNHPLWRLGTTVFHIRAYDYRGDPANVSAEVRNIYVNNVVVHDSANIGLAIEGGSRYYDDHIRGYIPGKVYNITVENSEFYGNYKAGADAEGWSFMQDPPNDYSCFDITFRNNVSHDNGGDGIVIGLTVNGLIEYCTAYNNGALRDARVGLWTWESKNVTIQFCESYGNVTPGEHDGSGFDLDMGAIDCVLQYNWYHDNEGEGVLIMTWPCRGRGISVNQVMRYNIGENNAVKNETGDIFFFGACDAYVYNNTMYWTHDGTEIGGPKGTGLAAIYATTWGAGGKPYAEFYNNIVYVNTTPTEDATLVQLDTGSYVFDYNCYYRNIGGAKFIVGGKEKNWSQWQGLGYDLHGLNTDPMLVNPGVGDVYDYQLQATSPCIDAGVDVSTLGLDPGSQDYFGTPIPQGAAYDIGADEY